MSIISLGTKIVDLRPGVGSGSGGGGLDPAAFVTEWTVSAGDTIKLPSYDGSHSGFTLDYDVDWGDGNSDSNVTTDDKTHTYSSAGTYQVVITNQFGSLNMWRASATEQGYLTNMVQWGTDNIWSSIKQMFYNCVNMLYEATDFPNLTNLVESTDASEVFVNCSSITSIDISNWVNTSNITSLAGFFKEIDACTSLNASGLDFSSVTTFDYGLKEVGSAAVGGCAIDLSNITWGSLTTASSALYNIDALSLDLSGWDFTGNPDVNLSRFFYNLDFNTSLDLSSWINFSASSLSWTFRYADITSVNISGWDTSNCTDFSAMFLQCNDIEQVIGLDELSSTSVTGGGLSDMFGQCKNISFTGAANNFSTAWGLGLVNCTSVWSMFYYAGRNRVSPGDPPNVGNWVLSGVTSFNGMFNATYFSSAPDIEDWDVSSATNFSYFMRDSNFTVDYAYDLSNWNFTTSLTNVQYMFRDCHNQSSGTGLTSLEFDSANCDFGGVTNFIAFVYNCYSLTSLKFTGATNFSSVTDISYFAHRTALTNLDLGTVQNFSSSANNWGQFGYWWTGGIASVDFLTTANIPATTGLSNMFQSSQVATADYDKLLQALVNVGNSNGNLHGGNSTYTAAGAGGTARAALVTAGWTITDGGGV